MRPAIEAACVLGSYCSGDLAKYVAGDVPRERAIELSYNFLRSDAIRTDNIR